MGLKFPSKGLDLSTGRFGYHIWETHLQTFLSWSNCQSPAQVLMLAVVLLAFTEGLQWDEVGKHYEHPKLINAHIHIYIYMYNIYIYIYIYIYLFIYLSYIYIYIFIIYTHIICMPQKNIQFLGFHEVLLGSFNLIIPEENQI